jgi:hypothetical protein
MYLRSILLLTRIIASRLEPRHSSAMIEDGWVNVDEVAVSKGLKDAIFER